MRRPFATCLLGFIILSSGLFSGVARTAGPIEYRLSFPALEHHWMQVEATFPDVGSDAIDLRMSRSSPGRYAIHDFAKNVYDVHAFGADGRELPTAEPDAHGWRVQGHGGSIAFKYKVFGDRVDGTYLGLDPTHAHINMPAALAFARGLDDRSSVVTLVPPPGRERWQVATQLLPSSDPHRFTAPNLQYLMDSPVEFGPIALRSFVLDGRTFRFAAHHDGTNDELDRFVENVKAIVAEQRTVFGEYPTYEPGHYTFLADYLPYADGDGMEHRNSTVITAPSAIRSDRLRLLGTASHEFFHTWNVERIRPRSLEPFDFESANVSSELWLAEGFTQYYGVLTLARAGLEDVAATARAMTDFVSSVALSSARLARTPDDMSRMAVFTDGARPIDRTNWSSTYVSYYPQGAAIALALDLTLRERFEGRVTLDDFMRAMWRVHGKPGGSRPGYVDRPYALADAEARLAEVSGSPEFAREFFARYILGHEIADYERLLGAAGLALRRQRPDAAWAGRVEFARGSRGLRIEDATMPGSPLHQAGLNRGDEILEIDGHRATTEDEVVRRIAARRPRDTVQVRVADRSGVERIVALTLAADPSIEVLPAESAGRRLTEAHRAFRQQWLGSRQ